MQRQRQKINMVQHITPKSNIQDIIQRQEYIQCCICTENYDVDKRIPMIACRECFKIVCIVCLNQKIQSCKLKGTFNKCFFCPQELIPSRFQKCHILINFLDIYQRKIKVKQAEYIESFKKIQEYYENLLANEIAKVKHQFNKEIKQLLAKKQQNDKKIKELEEKQLSINQRYQQVQNQNKQLRQQMQKIEAQYKVLNLKTKYHDNGKLIPINNKQNVDEKYIKLQKQNQKHDFKELNIIKEVRSLWNKTQVIKIQLLNQPKTIIQFKENQNKVDFSKTKIIDQQVRAVCQLLPHLRLLYLNQCQLIKSVKLKGCRKLEKLQLTWIQSVTDIQLQQMPALKKLNLQNCPKLQSIKLVNCPQITNINLSSTQIDVKSLLILAQQCPNLERLHLSSCKNIKQFKHLSKLKKLKELRLEGTNIIDQDLILISKQLTQLEILDLQNCFYINQLIQLKHCKKLKELWLRGLNLSQDKLVELLTQQFPQLIKLVLSEWEHVLLSQLNFTNCKKLSQLYLSNTEMTDDDVQRLGTQIPQLRQLSLYGCKKIVNPSLNNFGKLKKIYLNYTSVIKKKAQELIKKHPNIKIQNDFYL